MRSKTAPLAVLAMLACGPKAPPESAGPPQPAITEITCPPGTVATGAAPPLGVEVWCDRPMPDGTFVRTGPAIQWHGNGQKKSTGAYLADKREGPWLFWYATGTPEKQGSYANGREDGVWTSYHASGERSSEGQMVDGKENGRWMYWDDETLTRTEGEYILGDREGTWIDYGPDDRPLRERIYRGGRLVSQGEL
jgi:hypothetical protein